MTLNKYSTALLLTFFVSVLFTDSAMGCSCRRVKTSCQEYSFADAVIIGKIKEVEVERVKADDGYSQMNQKVTVEVLKSYKGTEEKQIIILIERTTSCDWIFTPEYKGQTFLFYLHSLKQQNAYRIELCGGSQRISDAHDELSWLDGLPDSLKRTRFSGTVKIYENHQVKFVDSLIGTKVRLYNNRYYFEAVVDKNGVYEIWDIPIGTYKIIPEFPENYKIYLTSHLGSITITRLPSKEIEAGHSLKIYPDRCGEMDYILEKKIPVNN